jgi:ribosome-associated heat shock protein Hsp15
MRLDKWLWAVRFYKTRALSAEAVEGGKVHLNGQRTKPGKTVKIGSRLLIHKGELSWEVEVLDLPTQRRPASEARLAYHEDQSSVDRREALVAEQRLQRQLTPVAPASRPNKRDRRLIQRFKQDRS